MKRRNFTREFKLEAVRLSTEPGAGNYEQTVLRRQTLIFCMTNAKSKTKNDRTTVF
jgi:hypothetical protein